MCLQPSAQRKEANNHRNRGEIPREKSAKPICEGVPVGYSRHTRLSYPSILPKQQSGLKSCVHKERWDFSNKSRDDETKSSLASDFAGRSIAPIFLYFCHLNVEA